MRTAPPAAGFGIELTPLAKRVLVTLIAMFIGQLVLEQWMHLPLTSWLGWHDLNHPDFQIWQPLTAYALNGPGIGAAIFDWIFIVFFFAPVQRTIGRKGLIRVTAMAVAIGAVMGLGLNAMGAISGRGIFTGLNPLLTPLIVIFGLSRPNAQILLMFVLPIKAAWIAWGTGLFAFLMFLSSRDLAATLWLAGWLAGYLYMDDRSTGALKKAWLRHKQKQLQARLSRFEVIEGEGENPHRGRRPLWGAGSEDDTVH